MKKILLFLLAFLACAYSAQADMKLACPASDWGNSTWVFTDNQDGTWTYTIDDASTISKSDFKILVDGNWYGLTGSTFNVGDTKTLYKKDGGNAKFGTLSGKVTLKLTNKVDGDNPNITLTITAEGSTPTPTYTDLYIVYKNGDGWDALDENLKFTTEDGTNYVLNDVEITAGATFAIGNADLKFGIDNAVMTPAATLETAENRSGWSNNVKYGKWAETIERNVNIVATLGSVQSWGGRQIDFKVYYVEGTTPDPDPYPTSLYLYPGGKAIPAVAGKDGVYSVSGLTKSEIASFRFNTKSNNSGTAYGTTTGENVAISVGDLIDMKEGGGNRWTLTPEFDGTYDIEIDLSTMKFFVTQSKVTYPDVIYYYNGAKPCTVTLANIGDGEYSADITVAAGESFRFYTDINATDNLTSYGAETADQALTLGSDITIVNNTTNKWSIAEAGTYTFTVSLKHHRLNVVKKSVTPTYTEFWLVGEETLNGEGAAWSFVDAFKFETTDGVTYTLKNVSVTAGKQFKISDKTRYFGYGKKDGQLEILPGNSYNIFIKDGENGTKNLAWYSTIACNVNITFTLNESDSNAGNIKVEYVYPTLWLRGIGGNWSAKEEYKMDPVDGVYTLNGITLSNTTFKIGSDESKNWTWGFGSSSTEDGGELAVDADGVDYTIYAVKDGKDLKIGEVSGKVNITFIPDFTNHRGTLRITRNYTPGEGITVYVVAPYEATETPHIYRHTNENATIGAAWPGDEMTKEVGLYYFDGTDTRDVYTYKMDDACRVIINSDGGAWRNPADSKPGISVTESTVIIFTSNTDVETKAYDPALFTNVSGIEDVEISNEAPVEFYNLQGVRVDGELTPGLYIRRQGNSASKVLIR